MASILVKLFEHNLWANLKVCDVCSRLTEAQLDATVAGTAGSVRATLMHLARAEQRYVERLSGRTLTIHERDVWSGVESVRAAIEASGRALIDLAGRADPDEVFSVDYQGSARALPVAVLYVQAINHATEHRSQIATILTQQGVEPPDFSGWAWRDSLVAP